MKRRNLLKQGLGGSVALAAAASPAIGQTAKTLRVLSAEAKNTDGLKSRIETATNGAMQIEVKPVAAGQDATILTAVSQGEAEMGLMSLRHLVSQNRGFGIFASMPFGMSASELESWILASDGGELLAELGTDHGVTFHLASDGGVLPMWSRTAIPDAGSFAAMKIGSTGLGIQSLKAMGAGQVFDLDDPAVDWSSLDVLEGVSIMELQERGLADTFSNMANVNPNTPSMLSMLVVSASAMDGMSENERLVLERACSAEFSTSRARTFHEGAVMLNNAQNAINSYDLPSDVWDALNGAARDVLQNIFDSGDMQASLVDAYVYFLTDIARWSDIGEAAYFSGRKRLNQV